jgi:hypothetical protein
VEARPNKSWLTRGSRGSAGAENSYHGAARARPRVVKIVPEALESQSWSSGGSLQWRLTPRAVEANPVAVEANSGATDTHSIFEYL